MTLEFKIAETVEDKIDCFKVRYHAYLETGYVKSGDYEKEMIIDEYDSISTIFAAKSDEKVVGTIRITPDSKLGFQQKSFLILENFVERVNRCGNPLKLWHSQCRIISCCLAW